MGDDERTPAYRCELCGGITFKTDSRICSSGLSVFVNNGPQVTEVGDVPRSVIHKCPHGGHGIARIVGAVPQATLHAAVSLKHGEDDETLN